MAQRQSTRWVVLGRREAAWQKGGRRPRRPRCCPPPLIIYPVVDDLLSPEFPLGIELALLI
jgi:hypothetical protein